MAGEKDVRLAGAAAAAPRGLAARGLDAGYVGRAVVSGVELEVRAGEVTTLVGPNGAGKSTILRTLAALLEPVAGRVLVDGEPLRRLGAVERARRLSVVLTDRPRTELLTCEDVVESGRYPYTGRFGALSGHDREVVRRTMLLTNTWGMRDEDFMRLSDGQRQRVLLARAICQEPDVLLLDEPTSYLDVRYQVELLSILRELARTEGVAVVATLHELQLARVVSDQVVCVRDGRVFACGTPAEVFVPEVIDALFDLEPGSYDPATGAVRLPAAPGRGGEA
ncbi:ABC transporter ATP-binding protein [Olsenella sp. YH-ols2223]|uniref:ABC transporter ATP-binding protein n=1 Tax=Olsenella absiana TaxID=3115222 RepID=A0ABU7R769_9ACTN